MDHPSLNHYEEQLYSVFKTFDVNNEEALNKSAVVALCDALQLEERGTTLVDTLFERRAQRVTFAQFRSGLLAVLGGDTQPQPEPAPPCASPERARPPLGPPTHSDEDSSGREVAPKFVFGSKKYGRRSRPHRTLSAPEDGTRSVCIDGHNIDSQERARRRTRCPRSSSMSRQERDTSPDPVPDLEHDSRIDRESALALCHRLQMDNIDRQLVESIFDAHQAAETTVGEFFDRLNSSLTGSVGTTSGNIVEGDCTNNNEEFSTDDTLPSECVIESWESAGVQQPRRLLAELGFAGVAVRAPDVEAALEEELGALAEGEDARALLLTAALALSRLLRRRASRALEAARAERDRLRTDVAECNRRAAALAQEVDDNHARLEAELTGNLRRAEARHADALRGLEAERAADRERAVADRGALEAELARRLDAELQLRAEMQACSARAAEQEARAGAAEERAAAADRESARLCGELRAERECARAAARASAAAPAELLARLQQLRAENEQLRDRCDELCAALETRAPDAPPPAPALGASWREEAGAAEHECSVDGSSSLPCVESAGESAPQPALAHAGCQTETADEQLEIQKLNALVKELESSLDAMRVEYERCEEYWAGKVAGERALQAAEQAAGDARLAELAARIADYERQFAGGAAGARQLHTIDERAPLEAQVTDLERELADARDLHARDLQQADRDLAALRDKLQRRDNHPQAACACSAGRCRWARECCVLRARLAAAERAAARLAHRLHAADLLVKDLYLDTCRTEHARHV